MKTFFTSSFAVLFIGSRLVPALALPAWEPPRIPRALPDGAESLAIDENTGELIAFDSSGSELGIVPPEPEAQNITRRNPAGACTALSQDDVEKLPGWEKLKETAKSNWGNGKYKLVTNPKEYKDRPANICVSDDAIQIKIDGKPDCDESKQNTEGELVGTKGKVTLKWTKGSSFSQTSTVTQEASIATGMTASVQFGIPEVADVSISTSITTTFTNSQSKATSSDKNTQHEDSVEMEAPEGKKCRLNAVHKGCTLNGSGEVLFLAQGWVWFNYHDKTEGHYKWALNIESTLKDVKDRSSAMKFSTAMKTSTNTNFGGVCE